LYALPNPILASAGNQWSALICCVFLASFSVNPCAKLMDRKFQ